MIRVSTQLHTWQFQHCPPSLLPVLGPSPHHVTRCQSTRSPDPAQSRSMFVVAATAGVMRRASCLSCTTKHKPLLAAPCLQEYRTPYMMRSACGILLHIFAIILAPYFAHFCDSWISLGHSENA